MTVTYTTMMYTWLQFSYDDLRVTQIPDALGGLTSFSYDNNGNLLTVTDAKNQSTSYTYDEMDRLKTRMDALSRTESYQYDANGNLSKFTDRKSQVATFSYDTLNRRTGATYPDSSVTFGYDAIGRLTSVSDSVGGNVTWTYDTVSSGHHPRVQETTTPGTVTVEYDEIGRRLKLSATGQTDVTYTYDKNSRLKTVTQGSQTVTLSYDDAGRRTSFTYPNGVATSYGYDNANQLISIDHIKTPTTIEALTYQNDAAGNRIKLTRANAVASLIPQAVTNTAFDAANEQTQFNSASTNLVYDNNGNLTSFTDTSGTTTYAWNARNQLMAISGPSLSASFVYDGLGRRSSKTINSMTTGFWYDGDDVLAELSGSTPTATYIRSLSFDEPFIRKQSGGDEFYQTDALGSTLTLTDSSGASSTTYTQEPFGKTTKIGSSTNAFQYTGREEDGTNVFYYRARFYHSGIQRFLSEDPYNFASLQIAGGSGSLDDQLQISAFLAVPKRHHPYSYVGNTPTLYVDPSGLLFGGNVNAGEEYGEYAAQWWADVAFEYNDPLYLPSFLSLASSLWGRKTSDATLEALSLGYNVGLWHKYGLTLGRQVRIAVHGPHHYFRFFGQRLPHIQMNWWQTGVRGSGGVFRIPFPKSWWK
ncbi:MAG: hypothetical protein NW701_03355 [Nitrospira sp.]